jgi:hypothetical protein
MVLRDLPSVMGMFFKDAIIVQHENRVNRVISASREGDGRPPGSGRPGASGTHPQPVALRGSHFKADPMLRVRAQGGFLD